jgi:hypothetical protein
VGFKKLRNFDRGRESASGTQIILYRDGISIGNVVRNSVEKTQLRVKTSGLNYTLPLFITCGLGHSAFFSLNFLV